MNCRFAVLAILGMTWTPLGAQEPSKAIKILFFGDNGHHRPADRFRQIQPVLAPRGIELTYTDKVESLEPKFLADYDGLLIYANTTRISPEQEQALLDFVDGGKGFIPVHCASYCFLNSPKYVDLVGAQFRRHGTGTFRTMIAEPDHPITKGFSGFESWDETYVHTRHNEKDRTVLEFRAEGDGKEPWTWVRTQGKGRVFYTAWGHDARTWGNPGFQDLVERGIRWATGTGAKGESGKPKADHAVSFDRPFTVPEMTTKRTDVQPFEYVDVGKKIPNYTPGRQWGSQGEAFSQMQVPLPAEESLKHMVVPQGFHVELFAAEPDLGGKPIAMNWDERGRLWVCETYDYPNELQPPGQGRDRIRICEDTDGDGRADKFTVFAEQLSIPTSLTFAHGGVIVFNGTQTEYLKDTDGDDVADQRHVLFGTWSQRDTHGGPSNMQYGLDNWIWGMQGYNFSRLTLGGETHEFRQGFFRFRIAPSELQTAGAENSALRTPHSALEFIRSTDNNTWGFGMSEEGIIFGSTANRNPSVYMPIPNRYYERVKGWTASLTLRMISDTHLFKPITDKVRQVDQHGGYTAAAGHALYTARTYPREYWNRVAFVAEPTGHLVGAFVLRRDGSHFRSNNSFNLLASDDEWTSPIMAEVGPDGNVWVIDWYNYIVQHNPTPVGFRTGRGAAYESDLRDKKHGRVYRVVYGKGSGVGGQGSGSERLSLAGASPQKLVETLKHDNLLWRRHAQRLLVERGKQDVTPTLIALVKDRSVDEIGLNVGAIHALWTLKGLGVLDDAESETAYQVMLAGLHHPSNGVVRNALQMVPNTSRGRGSVVAILQCGAFHSEDRQLCLAALLALADAPPDEHAANALASLLCDPDLHNDRWLLDAATAAAANNAGAFLAAVAKSDAKGLSLATATERIAIVADHYARGAPLDTVAVLADHLSEASGPVADAIVLGLARGWPRNQPLPASETMGDALTRLLPRLSTAGKGQLVRLAATWGIKALEKHGEEIAAAFLATAVDDAQRDRARVEAARQFIQFRASDEKAVEQLLESVSPRTSPEVAAGLVEALGGSQAAATSAAIVRRVPSLTPSARAAALRVLMSRTEWTEALLDELRDGRLPWGELTLEQKQALVAHPNRQLASRARRLLERGGGLPNADRQKVLEELLPLTAQTADAVAGKEVFKKQCAKCHTHSGEGTKIGPDLTGVAVHPKKELLTHLIDPSRNVEGNFRVYTVVLADGRILNGLLASESRTAIELFDAEGKKHAVLREDIQELAASNKSLMPEGFEKQVPPEDIANLLEFLTQRGKYLPLPLDKAATVVSTRGMFNGPEAMGERLVFDDWQPKTVEGVPFALVDPQGDRVPNVVLLYGPGGRIPPTMPRSVSLLCNSPAKAIHLLSGISGWGHPYGEKGSVSLIVRLHYEDGATEDHALKNGEHFADYIRRVDVPGSQFAFSLRGRQVRYLALTPQKHDKIARIELVKGPDDTAPVVMAVTVETLP